MKYHKEMYIIKNSPIVIIVGSSFFFLIAVTYWLSLSGVNLGMDIRYFYKPATSLLSLFVAPLVLFIMANTTFSAWRNYEKVFAEYSDLPSFKKYDVKNKKRYLLVLFISQIATPVVILFFTLVNLF